MTVAFGTVFIPAATLNQPFNFTFTAVGGTAPYNYAIISGTLPSGLALQPDGRIVGTPTNIGVTQLVVEVSDSALATAVSTFKLTTLDVIDLSSLTVDQAQFVQQLSNTLISKLTWTSGITTQTSQTLLELIAAIGTFDTAKILRTKEDAFSETAQSDSAILAIASSQGLRLGRKLPAGVSISIASSVNTSIPPYTQFSGAGYSWFNSQQIILQAGIPITVILGEGLVKVSTIRGLGTSLQAFVAQEPGFVVSDQDVQVVINSTILFKTFEGLWNYPQVSGGGSQQQAFADRTLSDGRLMIQFGSAGYGAIPGVNDTVKITYVVTQGDSVNSLVVTNAAVTSLGYPTVTAIFTSNPTGGAAQRNPVAYKNFAAGTFGTFSSGVTKSQYKSVVNNYPGIVDTVTQSQREINPSALAWMNVIRISALTASPFTQTQIRAYLDYCQSQTMYSTYLVWQDPQPILVDVDLTVYCYNSVQSTASITAVVMAAIQKLFAPRTGLLLTNFFASDLIETAINAAPDQISYVVVNQPTQPMIVTSPPSPTPSFQILSPGGSIPPGVYNYAISVNTPTPNPNFKGSIRAGAFTNFPNATLAGQYWLISLDGNLRDPATGALYPVNIGDQILATSAGFLSGNFTIVHNPVGVIDIGSPTNFVFPQVTAPNSKVVLDWTSTATPNALQYFVWGRVGGSIGIISNIDSQTTSFVDPGTFTPVVIPVTAYSSSAIRYNKLHTLKVTTNFSDRQISATLPVRDTL